MEETQKLTPEELQEFKSLQEGYQKAVFELGLINLDLNATNKQLDRLITRRTELLQHVDVVMEKQQALGVTLGEKYGDKQVDLETGELK
jgi:ATP-dependent Clp protease ATP-binding subunit ClpA